MSDENFSGSLGCIGHLRIGQGSSSILLEPGAGGNSLVMRSGGNSNVVPIPVASNYGPPMSSGLWYNPNGTGTTGNVAQNARAVMTPVQFPIACTLNGISVDVTVNGDAGSKIRFGLYTDASGLPGTLVQDFGTVAGDSTGPNPLTISQAVTAQWYWVCSAFQLQPSVRTTVRMANFNIFPPRVGLASPGGANNNVAYYFDTGMSGALPTSPGAPTNVLTPSNSPSVWLKGA